MIRAALAIFIIAVATVAILAVLGEAGHATIAWLGWRVDMTAAAAALLALGAALAGAVLWRFVLWILEAPRRSARARLESRRRQGLEVLSRGFLAAAAGDGSEARRLAQKAVDLAEDTPGLVRLLAAQAAEAAGDAAATQGAYTAMLGFPEMRLAGLKGLMQLAQSQGDIEGARAHAEAAYALGKTARWAWAAVLQAKLEAADWDAGLALVSGALERKIVPPIVADRARAALLAASAAGLEGALEGKARESATGRALEAAKLQPGFAPGVVMAARRLSAEGKLSRAAALIENAWRESPHPALWMAYRDLKTDETPRQRADRLGDLVELNPTARESRILAVEQALVAGDAVAARSAAAGLAEGAVTARVAGLMARVAHANGQADEARAWMARAAAAAQEPDWSDLDPEGGAFAYGQKDWARLVMTYAETGELIHPRHERRERTITELPELPLAYAEPARFRGGAPVEPVMYPLDDPGLPDDDGYAAPPATGRRAQRR